MIIGPLDTNKVTVCDFESYFDSEYTLRKMRQESYVMDPRFKVHGVATVSHKGKSDWVDGKDIPKWLKSHKGDTFVNHKMDFDGLIWALRYNHVAPFMVDTKSMANVLFGPAEISGGNDLDSVGQRLGFQPKGKIDMFKGKYDLTPEERLAMISYASNDGDITFKSFHAMLPMLSRPEFELWLIDHTLRIYLSKPLRVNARKAKLGIEKVQDRIRSTIKAIPKIEFQYTYDKSRVRKGQKFKEKITATKVVTEEVLASNPQFGQAMKQVLDREHVNIPMKHGKRGLIPALAKADEGFMSLRSSKSPVVRSMVTARLAKRSGDTQVARLRSLLLASAAGGFRVFLNYGGAGTGRWSGGSGLNAHNFPNPSRSTDEFEREVANIIRESVEPDKGKKYVATDAANIEARVVAWWAGQTDLVNAFGDGNDVYSSFATETFKEEVRKPKEGDSKAASSRFKLLRAAGKEAVLGLGYNMGAAKMELRMRSRPDVAPLFVSGDLTTEKCEAIVKLYRTKYSKIPELWRKAEAAFFSAREGATRMVNGVRFEPGGKKSVVIVLPSGRRLVYPDVRIGEHDHGHRGKRVQWVYGQGKGKKLYGGLIVENVVQAISRDILAEGVWAMEHAGYAVAYHVHDSIVCHVPAKEAKACLNYCIEVLSASPEWAPTMRLGAEGEITSAFA